MGRRTLSFVFGILYLGLGLCFPFRRGLLSSSEEEEESLRPLFDTGLDRLREFSLTVLVGDLGLRDLGGGLRVGDPGLPVLDFDWVFLLFEFFDFSPLTGDLEGLLDPEGLLDTDFDFDLLDLEGLLEGVLDLPEDSVLDLLRLRGGGEGEQEGDAGTIFPDFRLRLFRDFLRGFLSLAMPQWALQRSETTGSSRNFFSLLARMESLASTAAFAILH